MEQEPGPEKDVRRLGAIGKVVDLIKRSLGMSDRATKTRVPAEVPVGMTGRWMGHYLQHDQEHPISAEFVQVGERLSGTMSDGRPDGERSLFEVALESGLPPGTDEQIEASLREALPDAAAGPIRYVTRLPSESILEGRCRDQVVYFLKTYQGTSFTGYKAGDQNLLSIEKKGHEVHYDGRLSPDGLSLNGRWWIEANPEYGTRRVEGLFSLRRQEQPPDREATSAVESPLI